MATKSGTSNAKAVKAKLKAMKKGWKKIEAEQGGFKPISNGTWITRIDKAFLDVAKQSEELQIVFELKVLSGPDKGRTCRKWAGLAKDQNIAYTKGELQTLDIELPDDPEDLFELLEALTGTFVETTFKENGEFVNIYFQEVVNPDDLDLDGDDEEGSDADNVEDNEDGDDDDADNNVSDDDDDDADADADEDADADADDDDDEDEIDLSKMKKADLLALCEANGWKPNKSILADKLPRLRKYMQKKIDALNEEE